MGVVKGGRGRVAVSVSVGVPVGVPIAPVAVLAVVVVTAAILVPVGVLVLVPVRIVGGAVADKLPLVGLLDDSLSAVLQGKPGNRAGARTQGPRPCGTGIGDHPDHLVGAVGGTFLIKLDAIDDMVGASSAPLHARSRGMQEGGCGAGAEPQGREGKQCEEDAFHDDDEETMPRCWQNRHRAIRIVILNTDDEIACRQQVWVLHR